MLEIFLAGGLLRRLLDESDVIALEEDSSDVSFEVSFDVHLFDIVQHQIHVFVEADNDA